MVDETINDNLATLSVQSTGALLYTINANTFITDTPINYPPKTEQLLLLSGVSGGQYRVRVLTNGQLYTMDGIPVNDYLSGLVRYSTI